MGLMRESAAAAAAAAVADVDVDAACEASVVADSAVVAADSEADAVLVNQQGVATGAVAVFVRQKNYFADIHSWLEFETIESVANDHLSSLALEAVHFQPVAT